MLWPLALRGTLQEKALRSFILLCLSTSRALVSQYPSVIRGTHTVAIIIVIYCGFPNATQSYPISIGQLPSHSLLFTVIERRRQEKVLCNFPVLYDVLHQQHKLEKLLGAQTYGDQERPFQTLLFIQISDSHFQTGVSYSQLCT